MCERERERENQLSFVFTMFMSVIILLSVTSCFLYHSIAKVKSVIFILTVLLFACPDKLLLSAKARKDSLGTLL